MPKEIQLKTTKRYKTPLSDITPQVFCIHDAKMWLRLYNAIRFGLEEGLLVEGGDLGLEFGELFAEGAEF